MNPTGYAGSSGRAGDTFIIGGFLFNVPQILSGMFPIKEAADTGGMSEMVLTGISVAFGLGGIGLSYLMYVVNTDIPEKITSALGGVYTLVYNKYFVDEVYDAVIVHPLVQGSESVLWKTADAGSDRWHRERRGHAVAGHWQHSQAAAVGQYTKLRHLGGDRRGGVDCRYGDRHGCGYGQGAVR